MKIFDLDKINQYVDFKIDYFFCCASFEERCLSIVKNINVKNINNAVICINKDQVTTFGGLEVELQNRLQTIPCTILNLDTNSPISSASIIKDYLDSIESLHDKTILIDITTFTHELLLILYRILTYKNTNIYFIYNNAYDYSINEKNIEKKWLSAGVRDIRSIIGYSGFMSPLKLNLLLVLVGYEPERTIAIIDRYQPDYISLGVGSNKCTDIDSSILINKIKHEEIVKHFPNARSFQFDMLNTTAVKEAVEKEIKNYTNVNIIIAPMNNKISTLVMGNLALENDSIQLCYTPARFYNIEGYSIPGSKAFLFNL